MKVLSKRKYRFAQTTSCSSRQIQCRRTLIGKAVILKRSRLRVRVSPAVPNCLQFSAGHVPTIVVELLYQLEIQHDR